MKVKFSVMVAGSILLAMFSGCASQTGSSGGSGGSQMASASSGQKCDLDVKRICQEMRTAPSVDSETGLTLDSTAVEQSQPRTTRQFVTFQVPNGSTVGVSCEMNAQHHSVVYAHMMPGPPLTPNDVSYFENSGYCAH